MGEEQFSIFISNLKYFKAFSQPKFWGVKSLLGPSDPWAGPRYHNLALCFYHLIQKYLINIKLLNFFIEEFDKLVDL